MEGWCESGNWRVLYLFGYGYDLGEELHIVAVAGNALEGCNVRFDRDGQSMITTAISRQR